MYEDTTITLYEENKKFISFLWLQVVRRRKLISSITDSINQLISVINLLNYYKAMLYDYLKRERKTVVKF